MKTGLISFVAIIYAWLLFPATAVAQNACDSVLQLTGREKTIFMSKEQLKRYSDYREKNNESGKLGATIPVDGIPVQGNGSYESSSSMSHQQRESYERELFSFADRVFAPAVSAWSTCVNAKKKALNLNIRQIDDTSLLLDLTIDPGLTSTIKAVSYDTSHVDCRVNNKAIDPAEVWQVTGAGAWTLQCQRSGSFNGHVSISILSGVESFPIMIPERAGPATSLASGFSPIDFQTCNGTIPIMAANHDREIIQEAPSIRASDLSGRSANVVATVRFNDGAWGGGTVGVPSGHNSGGGNLPNPGPRILPAFTPAIITVQGSSSPGSCAYVKGTIRISK